MRGFGRVGILLLYIIGFGLPAVAYSNPGAAMAGSADVFVWATVELFAEGAMRGLFSMLFGAGVVLFVGDLAKGASLHYKRNFWLLVFGLIDAYVLLWNGDILVTYALVGAILYWVRNSSANRLITTGAVLFVLMSVIYGFTQLGMGMAASAAETVAAQQAADANAEIDPELLAAAEQWYGFRADFVDTPEQRVAELAERQASYWRALLWNVDKVNNMLAFVLPVVLFWDALAMMLLGMGLYKAGILQGQRSTGSYIKLMVGGFVLGLLANAFEVTRAIDSDFEFLSSFAQAQPTYHIGRLGMSLGYLGLIMLLIHKDMLSGLRTRLAAVGRMALTNYLMHSLICLFVFTGAGFALVGELLRWQLYLVVLAIWLLQMLISPWWLARYRFGPVEWLWRGLTYGRMPPMRRSV